VSTAFVNAGVEGTEFFIKVEEDKTFLSIFEGKVLASNDAGSLAITGGQSAVAEKGKAPVYRVVARPRDAVRWALYYPPVIYTPPEEAPVKEDTGNPSFLAHRASSLLSVGRVDEAKADIEKKQLIWQIRLLSPGQNPLRHKSPFLMHSRQVLTWKAHGQVLKKR